MRCRGLDAASPTQTAPAVDGSARFRAFMLRLIQLAAAPFLLFISSAIPRAQDGASPPAHGGEAALVVPALNDSGTVSFFGTSGANLLMAGIVVSLAGMAFGLWVYTQLKKAPVHPSMLEVSELIYATCKTYLLQQMKFVFLLWSFIATIIFIYFGFLQHYFAQGKAPQVFIIIFFSVVGILGSSSVAWFGIR